MAPFILTNSHGTTIKGSKCKDTFCYVWISRLAGGRDTLFKAIQKNHNSDFNVERMQICIICLVDIAY